MGEDLTIYLRETLLANGADLVGFGDLSEVPLVARLGLKTGISIALKYQKGVISGIHDSPTPEYMDAYNSLNERLDNLSELCAKLLREKGYIAVAQSQSYVKQNRVGFESLLPHKTVATRSGLGWIGKSALLVTEEYGSMIRLTSVITDADLKTGEPINSSKCGECTECRDICPAGAVSGNLWSLGTEREALMKAKLCSDSARSQSKQSLGESVTLCGKCIEICPYTRRYIENEAV